jgi:hypothetical protein
MKIQIAMNQKKKTSMAHSTSPNDQSVASIKYTPLFAPRELSAA